MSEMTQEQRLKILDETVRTFGKKEWFRDATVYNKHPLDSQPTLEIKVNYLPLFERREVKEFCNARGLADRFVIVDRDGKPVN